MEMETKDKAIIFVAICLLISSAVNISLIISNYNFEAPPPLGESLVIGTVSGPYDLDPTDCWDKDSQIVIEQVVETLFIYNTKQYIIDKTMPRINWLATGYSWDPTSTILTVDIRSGVRFHDRTPMDAAAVAWSFNRFLYLMNHTGELPSDGRAVKVHSLYEFPDGTPIFQSIVALDVDTVVFTLNAPYAPILDAMCYVSCGILSPTSTPNNTIIYWSGYNEDLIGTGPYMYDYYITDTEVRFTKFDEYWATNEPHNLEEPILFDRMIFSIIEPEPLLNFALLNRDIDILLNPMSDLFNTFRTDPLSTFYESETSGLTFNYLCFNTNQINITWRKAMSYAINYTFIIDEMLEGNAFRSYGPISTSYGPAFNPELSNIAAYYNLTVARQVILEGLGNDTRLDPRLQANDSRDDPLWLRVDLIEFNYSYNTDNWFRSDLYTVLNDSFDDIGITLNDGGSDWSYFILRAYGYVPWGYDQLQIYFISWDPDYLDPFNMIDPLYSNISHSNACQINDPVIMQMLLNALTETNDTARNEIYHDIQARLAGVLYPHAFLFHPKTYFVHSADLYDIPYNALGKWGIMSIKRNLTWLPDF